MTPHSMPPSGPDDPDATIWVLRHALRGDPDDVNSEIAFKLVAQLVLALPMPTSTDVN